MRKYDAAGNELWTRQFGTIYANYAYGVAVDGTGLYVAGYTDGTLPGQIDSGLHDAFVVKLDAIDGDDDGGWTRQFGSAGYDYADGIAVDGTGVYVTGYTYSHLPGQTNSGSLDAFVMKLDAIDGDDDGGWTRQFGSAGYDGAHVGSRCTARGYTLPEKPAVHSPARPARVAPTRSW